MLPERPSPGDKTMSRDWRERASVGLLRTIEIGEHRIREYADRLAIWRVDGERLGWEELQLVKELVWPGIVAMELYPAHKNVVNLRHTRHLWRAPASVIDKCRHPEFLSAPPAPGRT